MLVSITSQHERTIRLIGPRCPRMTPRQLDVLQLLANGRSIKQAASELKISHWTAAKHLRWAQDALGAETPNQAIARAIVLELIYVYMEATHMTPAIEATSPATDYNSDWKGGIHHDT